MNINNKRSYTEYTVTQPTTDFIIGFDDYEDTTKDTIVVTVNGVLAESQGYAVLRKSAQVVTITPAVTDGTVRLQRETAIDDSFHKFTAGALFSAKSVDENFAQIRHSQQETSDGFTFLEFNTNGIVQASKEATAQAKAATVEATASAVRAESAADTAVQAVGSLQGVVNAATTATTNANTATATANTAASQATAATTSAQNAAQAANTAKQEATTAVANANAATVATLAATGRANEAADVVADLVMGKVRAQDVSTADGSTQAVKNTEFRNELDILPFEDGLLPTSKIIYNSNTLGSVDRTQESKNADLIHAKDFGLVNSAFVDNTAKMRAALSANGVLNLEKGATYLIHEAILINDSISGINGNGAKIIFDREQTSISAYDESNALYNYDRKKPLFVRDLELEYTGTFDKGGSYDGQVSGIDIRAGQAFSGLSFKNITASGFNRAGIQIALGGEYISNVVVEDCYLHHNRIAGCWYGNVDNIRLQGNRCEYNGIASDSETGYGLSGISSYYPKNIFLLNNICNNNIRKGVDTHSGYNVFVQGNTCKKNGYYGIAVQNRNIVDGVVMPQGYIIIRNNSVTEMSNDGTTSLKSMYGIVAGKYEKGEPTTAKNTFILIEGNHVSDFTASGLGNAVPIEIAASGFNKLNVHISNNMVNVGRVDYFVSLTGERSYLSTGTPTPEASLNNYADYNITNNTFTAQNILSNVVRIPENIGTRSMKFDNNYLNITGAIGISAKYGLINFTSAVWEGVEKPINSTFTFRGNTVYIPSITEFIQDIVTNYSGPHILQEGNIFNGKPYRTYKDGVYFANLPAKPTTGLWTVGSVVRNTAPAVGSPSQWICTASGTAEAAVWSDAGVL